MMTAETRSESSKLDASSPAFTSNSLRTRLTTRLFRPDFDKVSSRAAEPTCTLLFYAAGRKVPRLF
jgi:hypothetical protein